MSDNIPSNIAFLESVRYISYSPFPIPHSPFPIPHSPFPIPHSPFPIPKNQEQKYLI
ncbi:MAG: hypothetical protein F6K31_01545 [Symploca sp. SIO2G7]|nr:hypothetical protein [Symploca sp. SIO2G7]